MSKTNLLFSDAVRAKIQAGAEKIEQAVGTTLGPRGRNVAIARTNPYGDIYARDIIHDGVKVAESIDLEDEQENMGAQVLREAAQKTVDAVGDGTTVTIILAHSVLSECLKIIGSGTNPMALREGLEKGRDKLIAELEQYAKPVKTKEDAIRIATISAQEESLGQLVGETLHQMGPEGVVTVEPSKSSQTTVKHQEGMQLDQGYLNNFFVTDPERMEAVIENPYILMTDREINNLADLGPMFNELVACGGGLVIIAPSYSLVVQELLVRNKMEGKLNVLAIKAPSFGINMKNTLQDMAILTGGKFITEDAALKLSEVKLVDLGRAEYVTSTKNESLIVGGMGSKEALATRVASLKKQIEEEESEFELVKMKERLGKLTNGVAVIYVGGYTEIEVKERRERADDAVLATRAAMQKGVVPGGEIMFLRIRGVLGDSLADRILFNALEQPFNKLVSNAGKDPGEMRVRLEIVQQTNPDFGYDVTDLDFKDLNQVGIVDPVLVGMKALENSISVAVQLMTTGAIVTPIKEDSKRVQNR